jgi:hypothetical protein
MMELKEIEYEGVEWIQVAQDRMHFRDLMNMSAMKFRFHKINEFLDQLCKY